MSGLINIYDSTTSFFSLSALEGNPPVYTFPTLSQTFCQATPSNSHPSLILSPTSSENHFGLLDIRIGQPKSYLPADGESVQQGFAYSSKITGPLGKDDSEIGNAFDKKGMICSLGFVSCGGEEDDHLVLVGCESGHIVAHDLRFNRGSVEATDADAGNNCWTSHQVTESKPSSSTLEQQQPNKSEGKPKGSVGEPALCLDAFLSKREETSLTFKAVVGFAGDSAELSIREGEGGTVGMLKIKMPKREVDEQLYVDAKAKAAESEVAEATILEIKLKSFQTTCKIGANSPGGKPGVNCINFSPSQKAYSVGGWDHRVRLFSSSLSKRGSTNLHEKSKAVAILKGHDSSVGGVDFMPGMEILGSGGTDGRIMLWNVAK